MLNFLSVLSMIALYVTNIDQHLSRGSSNLSLIVLIFTVILILTLTILVSRMASNIAKWILVVMFIIGIPGIIAIVATTGLTIPNLIGLGQGVPQTIALLMLFTRNSRLWFQRKWPLAPVEA